MRLSLLLLLAMAVRPATAEARPFQWPWSKRTTGAASQSPQDAQVQGATPQRQSLLGRLLRPLGNSRAKEQARLDAAMAPKPTSREEQLLRPDITKEFNPSAANFGSGRSLTGKAAATNEFYFQNKTRTKAFETKGIGTKEAWGMQSKYETKTAQTKESWFARLTARTKTYDTRESRDANKGLQGSVLPGSDQKFLARGRRQAELDADRAEGRAPKLPLGGDRDDGQSWNGDLKPLSIQDVKTLLNKN